LKLALTGTAVDEHFFQDSNGTAGTGVNVIAAVIPSYQVFDLTAEWSINKNFKLLGGVNNLFDEKYYSRVRTDGIEPAAERTPYLGLEVGF
jgi:Fe(3+) dicitrate transport protein